MSREICFVRTPAQGEALILDGADVQAVSLHPDLDVLLSRSSISSRRVNSYITPLEVEALQERADRAAAIALRSVDTGDDAAVARAAFEGRADMILWVMFAAVVLERVVADLKPEVLITFRGGREDGRLRDNFDPVNEGLFESAMRAAAESINLPRREIPFSIVQNAGEKPTRVPEDPRGTRPLARRTSLPTVKRAVRGVVTKRLWTPQTAIVFIADHMDSGLQIGLRRTINERRSSLRTLQLVTSSPRGRTRWRHFLENGIRERWLPVATGDLIDALDGRRDGSDVLGDQTTLTVIDEAALSDMVGSRMQRTLTTSALDSQWEWQRDQVAAALRNAKPWRYWMKETRPQLIVLPALQNSHYLGPELAAHSLGIPVIAHAHGMLVETRKARAPACVDCYAVPYGPVMADRIRASGVPAAQIAGVGIVDSEYADSRTPPANRGSIAVLSAKASAPATPDLWAHERTLQACVELSSLVPDREIIIKEHPRFDNWEMNRRVADDAVRRGLRVRVVRDMDLSRVLDDAQIAILSGVSTTAWMEAVKAGLPLVYCFTSRGAPDPAVEQAALCASEPEEIAPIVRRLLSDGTFRYAAVRRGRAHLEGLAGRANDTFLADFADIILDRYDRVRLP